MTNEELLAQLNAALADARAAAANANAAANTANAAANQASSGAAAGVAGARTQSNVEASQLSTNTDSDIGITEAWSANVKRTYDVHQTYDMETKERNRLHFDTIMSEQTKHLAQLNAISLQAITNNQNASKLAIYRQGNVDETDAFATILASKVAETLFEKAKSS